MPLLRSVPLLFLLFAPTVCAEEPSSPAPPAAPAPPKPPPGPSLDDRLAEVRKLTKGEKWKQALAELRDVFEEFKGSPEVLRRLPAIEEDLRLCTYQAQATPPAPADIFGAGTKSFTSATRLLVMEFPAGPVAPPWEGEPQASSRLMIRFEDVTVDFEGSLEGRLAASLSFDFDAESGYDLRAGCSSGKTREQASIARLENTPGAVSKRAIGLATCDNNAGPGSHRVRFSRKGDELSIQVDGRPLASAKDARFPHGFLGIRGTRGGSVTIRGKVDAAHVRARMEACAERRFKEWAEKSWNREEAIPEWARKEAK